MRIITWNIGCFSFLKFAKYLGISSCGHKIFNEYFQPEINGNFVSKYIEDSKPDILFLQEIYKVNDVDSIKILEQYPYKKLINTWYHKHSILVASKYEFSVNEREDFSVITFKDLNFIPIHLNSFYAKRRLEDCNYINSLISGMNNVIVLGDTNIWSRGDEFIFSNDKRAYKEITKNLVDYSKELISTTYIGLGFDKVFGSKNLKVSNIKSPKIRGHFMDHYPIVFDIEV